MFKTFNRQWFDSIFPNASSLAIVGNAPTLKNSRLGEFIDECDVVCRMNRYEIGAFKRDVGGRTDLYVSNFLHTKPPAELQRDGVKGILVSRPMSRKRYYNVGMGRMLKSFQSLRGFNITFVGEEDYDDLCAQLNIPVSEDSGRNPTTGLTTVYTMLRHLTVERVLLVGFNFFDRNHPDGVYYFRTDLFDNADLEDLHTKYHPQDWEIQVFRRLVEAYDNIILTRDLAERLTVDGVKILEERRAGTR